MGAMSTDGRTAIILDPHPLWADSLAVVLARVGVTTVARATEPAHALALVDEHRPDLLILEPELDGIAVIREARALVEGLKCIAVAVADDPEGIAATFDAGATAYILKSAHVDDMAAAVRQAFEHSIYFPMRFARLDRPPERTGAPSILTRREQEILRLTAEGLSNAGLAQRLWVTEQTVKFHLSNVYRKLGVSNRTEAARLAYQNGLVESPLDDH